MRCDLCGSHPVAAFITGGKLRTWYGNLDGVHEAIIRAPSHLRAVELIGPEWFRAFHQQFDGGTYIGPLPDGIPSDMEGVWLCDMSIDDAPWMPRNA